MSLLANQADEGTGGPGVAVEEAGEGGGGPDLAVPGPGLAMAVEEEQGLEEVLKVGTWQKGQEGPR